MHKYVYLLMLEHALLKHPITLPWISSLASRWSKTKRKVKSSLIHVLKVISKPAPPPHEMFVHSR